MDEVKRQDYAKNRKAMKTKHEKREYNISLLEAFLRFLHDNGYTDSDVYDERPTAVDQFMQEYSEYFAIEQLEPEGECRCGGIPNKPIYIPPPEQLSTNSWEKRNKVSIEEINKLTPPPQQPSDSAGEEVWITNLKHKAPIVREFNGFVVLAQDERDFESKRRKIAYGDKRGFYTVEEANKLTCPTVSEGEIEELWNKHYNTITNLMHYDSFKAAIKELLTSKE